MTVKFDEPTKTIGITPYTKNETYQYTGSTFGVNFTIANNESWDTTKYASYFRSFATKAKNGKDLAVTTLFYDVVKNTSKLVTTTMTNFFDGKYNYVSIPNLDANLFVSTLVNPNYESTYYVPSDDGEDFTTGADFILGSDGKHGALSLVNGGGDTVYDVKGDDTYYLAAQYYNSGSYDYTDAIYDFDGNDDYSAYSKNHAYIEDFKGNDIYYSDGEYAKTVVEDFAGKDEYYSSYGATLNVTDYNGNDGYFSYKGNFYVYDYLGNDYYMKDIYNDTDYSYTDITDIKGNDNYCFYPDETGVLAGAMRIDDIAGNDNYYFDNVRPTSYLYGSYHSQIMDQAGNDKYDITQSKGFAIYDDAGNDKFVLSNMKNLSSNYNSSDYFYLQDAGGNDTYDYINVEYSSTDGTNLVDSNGNDKYSFTYVKQLRLSDGDPLSTRPSGNDTYNIDDCIDVNIHDMGRGNDKYIITDSNRLDPDIDIEDDGGNDTYKISNSKSLYITDKTYGSEKSNDKYDISSGSDHIYIDDESGNETYNIKGSYDKKNDIIDWVGYVDIEENDGNDTYNLQYVNGYLYSANTSEIEDYYGKDKYNIINSRNLYVYDDDYDNDVYNLSGSYSGNIEFEDYYGCEKYTVKGTKDASLYNISIYDGGYNYESGGVKYKSDDTYNIEYVINNDSSWYIWDEGGNNTFNIKNSKIEVYVGDEEPGFDKFNISNCSLNDSLNFYIEDDGESTGTYNIKASSGWIDDYGYDDKYTISALGNNRIVVYDLYSSHDSLAISGINQKDLVYMTDFNRNGNHADSNSSLIIYDSKNKGIVQLREFFDEYSNGAYSYSEGDGYIEDLKVGKKFTDEDFSYCVESFNMIREEVGNWLSANNYTDVYGVLTSDRATADQDIAALTQLFTPHI